MTIRPVNPVHRQVERQTDIHTDTCRHTQTYRDAQRDVSWNVFMWIARPARPPSTAGDRRLHGRSLAGARAFIVAIDHDVLLLRLMA